MDAVARALGAGALLALAFPPLGWWWFAWFAPGLLYLGFTSLAGKGGIAGAGRAFCFGGALFLIGAHWVCELAWPLWLALLVFPGALFALYGAVNGAALPRLPRAIRPFAFALGWALFEWLRGLGLYATPWFTLASAHAHPTALPLLQCVSRIGSDGFGFLIALTAALLAEGAAQRRRRFLLAFLIPLSLLLVPMPAPKALPARLALLQADRVDSRARERYIALTRQAVKTRPDCIVWPEGAGTELGRARLGALAREVRTPLLAGVYETGRDGRPWNRALLFDGRGRLLGSYAKQRLAPFGEVYPFQKWVPGLYAGFGIHHGSYWAGEEPGVLTLPSGHKLGIGICFESAFPWVARQSTHQGADVLVFLTSDQSFGQSAELAQHRDQAVVRAVENRRPTVQAATTGLTVEIDTAGRVTQR